MSTFLDNLILLGIGVLLGVASTFLVEYIQRGIEKRSLIDLFTTDIHRNWKDIDSLRAAPVGEKVVGVRLGFKGISELAFLNAPEYHFETHNLKLFETEGFKLVQYLKPNAKVEFWEAYSLLRDIEQTRKLILRLSENHEDLESFQKLYVELIKRFSQTYSRLSVTLQERKMETLINLRFAILESGGISFN